MTEPAPTGTPETIVRTRQRWLVATLPFGAWFAFSIATLILVVQGHLIAAALLFGFSMALLGTFGGLETFGLVGLFIGPAVMSAVLLAWRQ